MKLKKMNNKGFTLVEVIVVAVIVAVLALVGIQLYTGYVAEARTNTVANLTASAAGYLQSAANAEQTSGSVDALGNLAGGASWKVGIGAGTDTVTFVCPSNASITKSGSNVIATINGVSDTVQWK